ncbi:MAG: hypothetical protein K2X47_14875 [Bdellovibrionales bacterium]|nr:hypothetical protein [Bdellovibrionales bacterium]
MVLKVYFCVFLAVLSIADLGYSNSCSRYVSGSSTERDLQEVVLGNRRLIFSGDFAPVDKFGDIPVGSIVTFPEEIPYTSNLRLRTGIVVKRTPSRVYVDIGNGRDQVEIFRRTMHGASVLRPAERLEGKYRPDDFHVEFADQGVARINDELRNRPYEAGPRAYEERKGLEAVRDHFEATAYNASRRNSVLQAQEDLDRMSTPVRPEDIRPGDNIIIEGREGVLFGRVLGLAATTRYNKPYLELTLEGPKIPNYKNRLWTNSFQYSTRIPVTAQVRKMN